MKRRVFSIFLILALILTSLAGCASGDDDATRTPDGGREEEGEQLLATGYYEVYDEDEELVGFIRVMSSKIVVYDERGNEGDTLPYDYNEKKETYTLEDGELFGCEKFTVEKSKKKLILITEDKDEYTLEEISKSDLPSPGEDKDPPSSEAPATDPPATPAPATPAPATPAPETPRPAEPATVNVQLPLGCYAAYYEGSLGGYFKVTAGTAILYEDDGYMDVELRYSYNQDGSCVLTDGSNRVTVRFTYERGYYYLNYESYAVRLESISESQIPVYDDGGSSSAEELYYIGGNGSIDLYAWLPDALLYDLDYESQSEVFMAAAEGTDYSSGANLVLYTALISGATLQEGIEEARGGYSGTYNSYADLMYRYFRDGYVATILDDLDEGYEMINGRNWRYCQYYQQGDGGYFVLLFWMEGNDLALVTLAGTGNASNYSDMVNTIVDVVYSLRLD